VEREFSSTTSRVEKREIQTRMAEELLRRRDLCRDDPARSDELHDLYVLNQEYMWKFSNQDDDWNAFTYYVEELDKQLCDAQTQQERKEAQSTLLDMLQEQMGKLDFDEQGIQISNWIEKYSNWDTTERVEQALTDISATRDSEDHTVSNGMQAAIEVVVNDNIEGMTTDMRYIH